MNRSIQGWAVRSKKSRKWLQAYVHEDAIYVAWSSNWNERTVFAVRKTARIMAGRFKHTKLVRITRIRTSRSQLVEIIRRAVWGPYVDAILHLLKTNSLKRAKMGLHMFPDVVADYTTMGITQIRRAGFYALADRLEHAKKR